MSEIEHIINEVDSSMSMAGLPLTSEYKERVLVCLKNPGMFACMVSELSQKHKNT